MTKTEKVADTLRKNREHFENELKMSVNQKLYDKKMISEDMYWAAKNVLLRQAV